MRRESIKSFFKTIGINLLSNIIWQIIISLIISSSISVIIDKAIKNIFSGLDKIIIFVSIESILLVILYILHIKKGTTNRNDATVEQEEVNNFEIEGSSNFLNSDYYFDDYTKHVTIYKNGNGIIMNTFDTIINDPNNFKEFKRKLNVEDGKKSLVFPPLSKMKELSKEKRFSDFGFWVYKPQDSIIASTVEKYWSDNDPDELDRVSKQNTKELRWVFEINRRKIIVGKANKISYAISILGLYPIEKGVFVKEIANEPELDGKASSSIHVEHYINKITYIISFEDGIKLEKEPECYTINGRREPIYNLYVEEGVFYNKYIFTINKPSYGTNVVVKWRFKGGDDMDKEGGD